MGAAAGPSDSRRQQTDRRNVVECYNSTETGRGVAHYVLGAFWVLLVTLWLCAMNAQRLYDTFLAPCPGPVLEPQPRNTPWCVAFARDLAREVAAADAGPGVDVVFYGDSITETWRGTDMGRGCRRCAGVPAVFQHYFGKYSTSVLAVGGDQAAHLLWRLQHGGTFVRKPPAVAVVMIGTNDLGASACLGGQAAIVRAANGTATRVEAALGHLRRANPRTQLLVLGVLPRGWTDAAHVYAWPSMYAPGIAALNAELAAWAARDADAVFLDCGAALLPGGKIEPRLMPDALHPNAEGMELFARCMAPAVDELFAAASGGGRRGLWKLGG